MQSPHCLVGVLSLNLSGLIVSFLLYLKPEGAGVIFLLLTEPADGISARILAGFPAFWKLSSVYH